MPAGGMGRGRNRGGANSGMQPEKLVQFLEAVYALELDDEAWLRGVGTATRDVWGRPAPTFSGLLDASDVHALRPAAIVMQGVPDELAAIFIRSGESMSPALIERLYRRSTAGTLRQMAPELIPTLDQTAAFGVADSFGIFGSDPNGLSCTVTLSAPAPLAVDPDDLAVYQRMAFHLAAAYRCRRRLRSDSAGGARVDTSAGAEAVLDSAGKVVHAEGLAKSRAVQETLKTAAQQFDRARTRGAGEDPREGIRAHRPLVDARWTLVDAREPGGKRYVVARENQAQVGGLRSLTERERQVVAFLALGRTTKEIAYTLGISDSTTRVLLARAASKLRVRTREELVRVATHEALPGLDPGEPDGSPPPPASQPPP
jgi:DNA-binding CsgD family transcriptional regulator